MPKILISGYYGFDNAGDELILKSIHSHLLQLNQEIKVVILSHNPAQTEFLHPRTKAIARSNLWQIFKELKSCDLFISGGGGLLQDKTGRGSVIYYLGLGYLAKKLFSKKVMLYAQGIGPLERKWSRRLINWWSEAVDLITLRDEPSKSLLDKLQVNKPKIIVTADPVLGLELPTTLKKSPDALSLKIGIILRKEAGTVKQWAEVCNFLKKEFEAEIVFIPFQKRDAALCQNIIRQLLAPAGIQIWDKIEDIFGFYQNLDIIISSRLHALILGILTGKLVVGISYDPKINNFLEIFEQKAVKIEEVPIKIKDVLNKKEQIDKLTKAMMPGLIKSSRYNAELACQLLKS